MTETSDHDQKQIKTFEEKMKERMESEEYKQRKVTFSKEGGSY